MFGQQNTSPFASPPATSPFGAPAPSAFGTVGFGAAPSTGGFGAPAPTAFGAPAFSSTFGAPTPAPTAFGGFGAPAPAAATSPFGAAAPATGLFGSAAPADSSGFGTSFASSSTQQPTGGFGGFGSTTTAQQSTFGAPAPSVFGAPAPATARGIFGSTPAPAFGAPAPGGLFGTPAPLFGGAPAAPAPGLFGASPPSQTGATGSSIFPFQPTNTADGALSFTFQCLSAQPQYQTKSFEEIRFEDYSQGNRGTASQAQQPSGGFGAGTFGIATPSLGTGFGGFGSPAPAPAAFGATAAAAPAGYGAQAPPAFGAAPAPAFGTAFGAAPAPAFGAPAPTFGAPAPAPAFGGFGAAKPPAASMFGASPPAAAPTGLFGSAPAPAGGLFGSTPAPALGGIFGAPAPGAFGATPAPATGGSLFGAPAPPPGGSLFNTPPAPAPAGGSLFGAPAPAPGGLFGAPTPGPAPGFGFGAQQPAAAPGGLFGARAPGTSLFGSPAPAPGGFFGAPAPAAPATGLFGAPPAPPPTPGGFGSPPYMIVQPTYDAVLQQALAAVENQRKELEQMEVWGGRSPRDSSVIPASQSELQALRVSPYSVTTTSAVPYRASPKSSVKIRPRGFVSPKPLSILKSPVPSMSPDSFIASSTKRLVIKSETPKPSMRLRLREVAAEESKEEPVLRLPAASLPVQEKTTRRPVAGSPFSSPSEAATPVGVTTPPDSAKMPETTPTNEHGYDFYNKVIASAGATPGSKKVASRVESKSLVPKLTMSGYSVAPSLEEMASMSEADLATVSGFTVSKAGVGSVSWDGSVDVRGVDLDEAISINVRDVAVYESAEANGSKPLVGNKLNRPAVITIYNVVPKAGANAEEIEKFERRVIKSTKNMNAELISYDVTSGVWKFRVSHFSRYRLVDDSEEEDEDMELEKPSSQYFESGERGGRSPEKESDISQKGGGDMDVSPSQSSAFVSEDEGVVDVPLVSDVETGVENNLVIEAERAYKMMAAAMASDRSQREQPTSILKKKQKEAEACFLFPDEGAVIEASVNLAPIRPDEQDLSMSSRPGVCARIARRCGVQSFSASNTDFGLRMGRSFRVGWKPDGSFLHLRPESITVIQQSRPVFTAESDGKEQVEMLLETHLKYSTKISSPSRECPSFSLAAGIDSSADSFVRKLLSDYVLASDRQGGKDSDPEEGLILMRAFSLLISLFTNRSNVSNDAVVPMIEGFESKKAQLALREAGLINDCVKWLKAACAEDVRKDVRDALQKNHVHSAIFAALAGGDIEQASSIAMKHGQLHLASLMATGAAGLNCIQDQVQQWHESGAAKTIPPELLRIYTLLGGDLTAEEQIHFAIINERRKIQLDWRRRLCMLFAFGSYPDEETTLESLIAKYERSVADDVAPYPFPRYLSNKHDDMKDDAQSAQSLLYRILKLASTIGECSSEHDLSSVSLATVVAPSGYTAASSDFSGAFHIAAAISALGLGPNLSPLEQARLLDGYASQLVNIGRWDLAVYVMLCAFGPDCSEDLVSREQVAKTLILQNYSETSLPGPIAKRSYLEKIGVPSAWFEEAVAYRFSHIGDAYEYVRHVSRCSPEQARRAIEELVVPNMLFMSATDLAKSLELLEVFSWDYDSLAATVLDFFQLSEDILTLSQNENVANESETFASLSQMATSVKERLLVHGAFTEGIEATSFGLTVIPSYRVVPMAAFLAESLAGISFLQLQLKALEAGSSIWGEPICRRPYKVASELAFMAAGDKSVSFESTAVASEVDLRGSI